MDGGGIVSYFDDGQGGSGRPFDLFLLGKISALEVRIEELEMAVGTGKHRPKVEDVG